MKGRSVKYSIIINFFISIILGIILTLLITFSFILVLHVFVLRVYNEFVYLYNTNQFFMIKFVLVEFLIFIMLMLFIFMKRMNTITDYIEEISQGVNKVANGNMNINIPIKANNELGKLAVNINEMAYRINELRNKEKKWEKSKNNLITNLSHDLRTPLTSVIGFLELIKNKKYKSEKELSHYFDISLRKANELKDLVDRLFEFTKITNKEIKLNKVKIHINELIEQVTMGFIPLFEENNMEYRISLNKSKITIDGDPILLARAFENIIYNSIKYGSSGKYLDINIVKENKLSISFINYGDRIEEDDLNSLLERLYRVKKHKKKEGTGLGLSIVKAIVEMHKGEILINSNKEKTEFKVVL